MSLAARKSRKNPTLMKFFCKKNLFLISFVSWVLSTFSSHCPLSINQRRQITSATLIIFTLKFLWKCWESNLGLLGEKQVSYLWAMQLCSYELNAINHYMVGYSKNLDFV